MKGQAVAQAMKQKKRGNSTRTFVARVRHYWSKADRNLREMLEMLLAAQT